MVKAKLELNRVGIVTFVLITGHTEELSCAGLSILVKTYAAIVDNNSKADFHFSKETGVSYIHIRRTKLLKTFFLRGCSLFFLSGIMALKTFNPRGIMLFIEGKEWQAPD